MIAADDLRPACWSLLSLGCIIFNKNNATILVLLSSPVSGCSHLDSSPPSPPSPTTVFYKSHLCLVATCSSVFKSHSTPKYWDSVFIKLFSACTCMYFKLKLSKVIGSVNTNTSNRLQLLEQSVEKKLAVSVRTYFLLFVVVVAVVCQKHKSSTMFNQQFVQEVVK